MLQMVVNVLNPDNGVVDGGERSPAAQAILDAHEEAPGALAVAVLVEPKSLEDDHGSPVLGLREDCP